MNATDFLPSNSLGQSVSASSSRLRKRVLILGRGQLAVEVAQVLASKRIPMVDVLGFIDHDGSRVGETVSNFTVIGTYGQLVQLVESYRVETIAVCLEDRRSFMPVATLLDLKAQGVDVVDGHHLYEEEAGRLSIDLIKPSALIFSSGFRRRKLAMGWKRFVDVIVAAVGLVAVLPIFVIVSALIKLDSHGQVFYRQVRVGLRGQPYMIWKFRSMRQDAEKSGPRWAQAGDPRVSRVGKWLRKTRIDELPQFINVLRGEMSLVGPRPERPVFVQELRTTIPYYDIRHTVRPGVTGWAQVKFRYGASQEDSHTKLQYDLYYVKNLSLFLDLRIMVHTIRVMMLGEGAQ